MVRCLKACIAIVIVTGSLAPGADGAESALLSNLNSCRERQELQQDDPLRFARSLYADGLYELAVDQLRQQLERGLPIQIALEGRWLLAQALEAAGRIQEAGHAYLDFTASHGSSPRAPEAWLRSGRLLEEAGEYGGSAEAYSSFLDLYPGNDQRPRASVGLITSLLADRRPREALDHAIEARRSYPFHPLQPRLILLEGEARSTLGEFDLALQLAGEALEASSTPEVRADAAGLKARLLVEAGNPDEAIVLARTALDAPAPDEQVPYLKSVLGEALEASGRHLEALPELREAVAGTQGARRIGAAVWLARALTSVGEPDSALAAYNIALEDSEGDEAAVIALEACHAILTGGSAVLALDYADRAGRQARSPEILFEAVKAASEALITLDRAAEAIDRYRTMLEVAELPTELRAEAAMSIGEFYRSQKSDPGAAVGYFRLAALSVERGDLWSRAVWASAGALADQGEFASAISELAPLAGAGGDSGERAEEKIEYWRTYRLVDLDSGLRALQGALLEMAEGGEAGSMGALLEIARANAGALKDFETAVDAYDRYLARESAGSRAAQAYLEKGRALEALAVIAAVERGEEEAVEPRVLAVEAYRDAVRVGGTSGASERAQLAIIELDLADLEEQPLLYYQVMRDRYRAFLDAFTASDRLNEVLLRLGEANEGLGAYADSSYYEEAASVYRLLLEGVKPEVVQAAARLGLGRSLYYMGSYSEAAPLLERSLTETAAESSHDQVLFMAGDARLKTGDNQVAVAHFRELETLFPASSWTARSSEVTGDLLRQQGRSQEAIASYRRFESSSADADRGRARLKLAGALAESGSWRESLELARLAATDTTLDTSSQLQAMMLWSEAAVALNDSDQLLTAYSAVWDAAPGGPEAAQIAPAFGDLLSARGELNSADEVWSSIAMNSASDSLRIRAEAELVYLAYAGNRIHTAESRRDMFEQTYRRRRDVLDRYRPMFWAVEGQVWLQSQEWDRAEAAFKEIEKEAPGSDYMPIALFGLGEIAARREEVDEARNYLEELVRTYPQDQQADRARFQLAALAYNEADYESALIYNRTAASSTDRVLAENSQYNLVLTLERMREYETARQEALTFLERYPDSESTFEMKMKLGGLFRSGGQLGRAVQWYRSIDAPDSEEEARVRFQLAETLFMMGEYQEAVLEYMKIAYLNEDQFLFAVTARLRAADSYAYLGERDQAVELYQGIIRRYGADSDYGRTARTHLDNVLAGRSPGALPPPPPGTLRSLSSLYKEGKP